MNHERYDDAYVRAILSDVKTVAVVGASPNPSRPSFFVTKYLVERGFEVYPINPGQAGQHIAGRLAYAHLADVPAPIDMVDVFRASAYVPQVLEEALALSPLPKVFWMQQGVRHDEAAARAEAAGLKVIMDRCPKIEYGRLSGEIGWTGVNSRILSSRRPQRLGEGVQRLSLSRTPPKPD